MTDVAKSHHNDAVESPASNGTFGVNGDVLHAKDAAEMSTQLFSFVSTLQREIDNDSGSGGVGK